MRSQLFEDWHTTTVTDPAIAFVAQEQYGWVDLENQRDVFIWLDVAQVTATGGTLFVQFESAPFADERLFTVIDPTFAVVALAVTSTSTVIALPNETVATAAARWLRWKVVPGAGISTPWGATFRLHVVSNLVTAAMSAYSRPGMATTLLASPFEQMATMASIERDPCPPDPSLRVYIRDFHGDWVKAPTDWNLPALPPKPSCCPPPKDPPPAIPVLPPPR